MTIRVLDVFSGLGGFTLGHFLVGGFETIAFCEINPYCRSILKKHFPHTPIFDDIRDVTAKSLQRAGITEIDCVCAGFPCQPHSQAGKRKSHADKRDLWPELYRVICDIQPRWVVLENVVGLLNSDAGRFFRGILWNLSQARFDVQWSTISCAQVGGVHLRERVFVIAYPQGGGRRTPRSAIAQTRTDVAPVSSSSELAHTNRTGLEGTGVCGATADSPENWTEIKPRLCGKDDGIPPLLDGSGLMSHADLAEWLPIATDANSIPYRRERLEALGNAIVPQAAAVAWRRLLSKASDLS